jgi:hypothetical protein
MQAKARFLTLFEQDALRAASRAPWTAGKSSATSVPMIAITTRSSTSVNPEREKRRLMDFSSVVPGRERPNFPKSKAVFCRRGIRR